MRQFLYIEHSKITLYIKTHLFSLAPSFMYFVAHLMNHKVHKVHKEKEKIN